MNILITAAGSELARNLAQAIAPLHTLRLTEMNLIENPQGTFVQSALGHDESTNDLVRSIEVIIHIAEVPPQLRDTAKHPDSYVIDYHTRCTYNLLTAAAAENVKHLIYASTLRLFENHDKNWTVTENWRPRPSAESLVIAKHLGEFTCREFARERKINVTCLRLGNLTTTENAQNAPYDPMWLEINDAATAFQAALEATEPWRIFHIQSEFPGARFAIEKAKEHLKFNPQFMPTPKSNRGTNENTHPRR